MLEGILKKDIHLLWPGQLIDESFVKCFLKASFDLLEHSQANKQSDFKQILFDILQISMDKYGKNNKYMLSQNITKIIDLLYNQENMATPMAEFVGLVVER
jgi:hypothetical protein